jgi:hypothetical protein
MQVFLQDHVAAAGESGVFVADQHRVERFLTGRVLGTVNKAQEVAVVEILKALPLIDHGDGVAEGRHDQACQLEAQIHPFRPDVEHYITRRRYGVSVFGVNLAERMQFGWTWRGKQSIPGLGPEPDDAR